MGFDNNLSRWKISPRHQHPKMVLAFGDGMNRSNSSGSSPRQMVDDWFSGQSPTTTSAAAAAAARYSNSTRRSLRKSIVLVAVVILSWSAAGYTTARTRRILRKLQDKHARHKLHLAHSYDDLDQCRQDYKQQTALIKKWQKTRDALEHELRVMTELSQAQVQLYPLPERPPTAVITEWFFHRKAGLQRQVDHRVNYLQKMDREWVLNNYGPGPHRVKFTAELDNKLRSSFTVELFPVDAMPHSVHFFLDLVTSHVWDDTVFLHHQAVEHLLATAPIDYYTQKVKHTHFHKLGWDSLGFPEYHEKYPHDKYTLGFAGQGPTFYINTVDNTYIHGPGGQGHHLLPQDGDPCFAKVVDGHDVVDALIAFGQQASALDSINELGEKIEHAWTHIVSVELLQPNTHRY